MEKLILIFFGLYILSGCAGPLVHPTKSEAEGRKDWYVCEQEAVAYASHMGTPSNPLIIGPRIRECMKMKYGWEDEKTPTITTYGDGTVDGYFSHDHTPLEDYSVTP